MNEIWKPEPTELCPLCDKSLYISSIIPQNGQFNFGCKNKECSITGFVIKGTAYFNFPEDLEDNENE